MAKSAKTTEVTELNIPRIQTGVVRVAIVGTSPLVLHRMAAKAQKELLIPARRKNRAERDTTLKHDPIDEYRDCLQQFRDESSPTLIGFPGGGLKKALSSAARDIPGAAKTQIGRLTQIEEWDVPIFGVPKLFLSVVRNSDMNHTPDIRSRPIIEHWAALFTIRFIRPHLTSEMIGNLLAAAGLIIGIGDGRQEKGWGSFGQFRLAEESDRELQQIIKSGGRSAQRKAVESPAFYNADTEELMSHYFSEVMHRTDVKSDTPRAKGNMRTPHLGRRSKANGVGAHA